MMLSTIQNSKSIPDALIEMVNYYEVRLGLLRYIYECFQVNNQKCLFELNFIADTQSATKRARRLRVLADRVTLEAQVISKFSDFIKELEGDLSCLHSAIK